MIKDFFGSAFRGIEKCFKLGVKALLLEIPKRLLILLMSFKGSLKLLELFKGKKNPEFIVYAL